MDLRLCSLYNAAEESVLHLFLECRISPVPKLYTLVSVLFFLILQITRSIIPYNKPKATAVNMGSGISSCTSNNAVLNNNIILCYEKILYDYRNNAKRISSHSFQHYSPRIQEVERNIAPYINKLSSHHKNGMIFWRFYRVVGELSIAEGAAHK